MPPVPVPYTPINPTLYTLAFDGALGGMVAAVRAETSIDPATYAYFTQVGRAFAISWDRAWNSAASLDTVQAGMCWDQSKGYWTHGTRVQIKTLISSRDPALNPDTYTPIIDGMIAAITAEEDAFAADGVTPPPWGGGGGGFTAGQDLKGTSSAQTVIGLNTMPLNQADTAPTASGVWVGDGTQLDYRQLTSDDIASGLTVTLSGGGAGTFETGATWTPGTTIVASPAANAGGVTHAVLSDTDGGTLNVLGDANPLNPPTASYTKTAQGAAESITLNLTQNGVTKNSNNLTSTWTFRHYAGCDDATTGTSIVADANNATLVGATDVPGAMIGALGAGGVGTTFTLTPVGVQSGYYACVHTAGAATFHDSNGFAFPMTRVGTNFGFTNQFAAATGFDLYLSGSPLAVPFTITRVS